MPAQIEVAILQDTRDRPRALRPFSAWCSTCHSTVWSKDRLGRNLNCEWTTKKPAIAAAEAHVALHQQASSYIERVSERKRVVGTVRGDE